MLILDSGSVGKKKRRHILRDGKFPRAVFFVSGGFGDSYFLLPRLYFLLPREQQSQKSSNNTGLIQKMLATRGGGGGDNKSVCLALTSCPSCRMNGQKQWSQVAVMALLVLAAMAAEGGKPEKPGEKKTKKTGKQSFKNTDTQADSPHSAQQRTIMLYIFDLAWRLFFVFVFLTGRQTLKWS